MNCHSSNVTDDNQSNSLDNQFSHESSNIDPSPRHSQNSQVSIISSEYLPPSLQQNGQCLPYQMKDTVIVPTGCPLDLSEIPIVITTKLRQFFIISGVLYLLWGTLLIGLETAIIMYSVSPFFRGIVAGNAMLGTGINMLIAAFSKSYSMNYITQLFYVVFMCCVMGLITTVTDLISTQPCYYGVIPLCDVDIAHRLKLTILAVFVVVTVYTGIDARMVSRVQKKAVATSSNINTVVRP